MEQISGRTALLFVYLLTYSVDFITLLLLLLFSFFFLYIYIFLKTAPDNICLNESRILEREIHKLITEIKEKNKR